MKRLVFAAMLLAALGMAGAWAQEPVRPNERYCLLTSGMAGPDMMLCRFETLEQCIASKAAPGEQCMLNPYLAFRRR